MTNKNGIVYNTNVKKYQVVIDTNVLVAALKSRSGASFKLLTLFESSQFEINISVPLVIEYEDVTKRFIGTLPYTEDDISDFIDYICKVSNRWKIYYLWRPYLRDPKDEMVLELAMTANCDFIVTHNKRDFQGVEQFGIRVMTPNEFLREIGDLS